MGRTKGSGKGNGRSSKKTKEGTSVPKTEKPRRGRPRKIMTVIKEEESQDYMRFFDTKYEPPSLWQRSNTGFNSYGRHISKPWEKQENLPNSDPTPLLRCMKKTDSDPEHDDLINIDLESEAGSLDFHYEFSEFPELPGKASIKDVKSDEFKAFLEKPFFTPSDRIWFY